MIHSERDISREKEREIERARKSVCERKSERTIEKGGKGERDRLHMEIHAFVKAALDA